MLRFAKKPVVLTAIFALIVLSSFYTSKSHSLVVVSYQPEPIQETAVPVVQEKVPETPEPEENDAPISLEPFMPKMENATLKQDLGRSTWKLLHNILGRYPEKPTDTEKESLKQFFNVFVKVYPCGDCAVHFQKLLEKYPPQVENKQAAATWGCNIHNKVNERLNKPIYDCKNILNDYDCGCGNEEDADYFKSISSGTKISDKETIEHLESIKIESSEGYQRGG